VPLARERTTIGRRADNDICLPNLAVSGEHAVVVTILADSFLEDLGSTNGTLVNGQPVAKHFLRDRDKIDIGRHRLVYCVDEEARLETEALAGMDRIAERDFGGRVDTAKPFVRKTPKRAPSPSPVVRPAQTTAPDALPSVEARGSASVAPATPLIDAQEAMAPIADEERGAIAAAGAAAGVAHAPPGPSIRLLNGASAGTSIALIKAETTVGRPGVLVASIVKSGASFRLKPIEGISAPVLNGRPVGREGAELTSGDVIEIAGSKLEFLDPARQSSEPNVVA
jgi:hypothetical protein